jgi:hypothetical protein
MAILIPSKNIYDMDNPKVRDNFIDSVSVEETEILPNNQYEISVYNETFRNISKYLGDTQLDGDMAYYKVGTTIGGVSIYDYAYAICQITPSYCDIDVNIPILSQLSYISKLILGKDKEDNSNIKISLIGTKTVSDVSATYDITNKKLDDITHLSYVKEVDDGYIEIPNYVEAETTNDYSLGYIKAYKKIELEDKSNINDENISTIKNDTFNIPLSYLLCGLTSYSLGATFDGQTEDLTIISVTGKEEVYTVKEVQISIYGNTIGISLQNGTVPYGDGNNPSTLQGNELLQDSGKTYGKSISQYLADNILTNYYRGKETATILCSISNYYGTDGNKAISIDNDIEKGVFEMGDIVIPKVYKNEGDVYMSTNSDGSPKEFQVCGVRFYYDGAVWQELSLQET